MTGGAVTVTTFSLLRAPSTRLKNSWRRAWLEGMTGVVSSAGNETGATGGVTGATNTTGATGASTSRSGADAGDPQSPAGGCTRGGAAGGATAGTKIGVLGTTTVCTRVE